MKSNARASTWGGMGFWVMGWIAISQTLTGKTRARRFNLALARGGVHLWGLHGLAGGVEVRSVRLGDGFKEFAECASGYQDSATATNMAEVNNLA